MAKGNTLERVTEVLASFIKSGRFYIDVNTTWYGGGVCPGCSAQTLTWQMIGVWFENENYCRAFYPVCPRCTRKMMNSHTQKLIIANRAEAFLSADPPGLVLLHEVTNTSRDI